MKSEKRDSNSRPQPWQGCALPTELFSHFIIMVIEPVLLSSCKYKLSIRLHKLLIKKKQKKIVSIKRRFFRDMIISCNKYYIKKLKSIPAPTAEPITPETLGAIACISR